MCEYAVLPLERVVIFFPSCLVVGVPVHAAISQVLYLCDALLPIAHLLIEESWLLRVRVHIWLAVDDVVELAASIIDTFAKV